MKINSRNALEDWLTENFGFQDGYVAELFPPSTTDTPVTEVRLRLRYQIEGGYEAGTPITYKEYLIRANGVKLWTYTENTAFSPSHCVERVDTLDDKDGFLTIQLDVPEFVILKCEELLVEDP